MTINQRFKKVIDELYNGNKSAFAKSVGVAPTVIENIVGTRQGNPSFEVIQKTLFANANISADWLITERGGMLDVQKTEVADEIQILSDRNTDYKKFQKQLIPIYNIEAAAGLVSLFQSPGNFIPIDYITLPNMGKVDGGVYAVGDSMYPLIKSGDIVIFRKINDMENNIFWGEMYLLSYDLEGEEYIVIKYLHESEKPGYIKLVSQNQYHSPKDIPLNRVRALAQVKASVRFNTIRPNQ